LQGLKPNIDLIGFSLRGFLTFKSVQIKGCSAATSATKGKAGVYAISESALVPSPESLIPAFIPSA